LLTVVTLILT